MNFATWQGATRNAGSARPGARALMSWCLDNYPMARNLGIYNYRPVRGSTSLSIHAEGRALDVGMPVVGGQAHAEGTRLLNRLGARGRELGIQTIIWNRRIYSARSPLGRTYSGVNPHVDHLHIELTRDAGERLTTTTIIGILGGTATRRVLRLTTPMMVGSDVAEVQRRLNIAADGIFGPATKDAVVRFQRLNNLTADGVVGAQTYRALGL